MRDVTWNGMHSEHLGSIQWDGKYLAVESPGSASRPTTVYRYTVSEAEATLAA